MNKRTTTEILADALDYVERHGPAKLGVELREVYRQSIGESPPDDNRWRSVAEQAEKAVIESQFMILNLKDTLEALNIRDPEYERRISRLISFNKEALAAFDSLRKEGK